MRNDQGKGVPGSAWADSTRAIGRALELLSRTTDLRLETSHAENTFLRMLGELVEAIDQVLGVMRPVLRLRITDAGFIVNKDGVESELYEEAFAAPRLYDSGLRALEFDRGVQLGDLQHLFDALAFERRGGLGDDVASVLWRGAPEKIRWKVETLDGEALDAEVEPILSEVWGESRAATRTLLVEALATNPTALDLSLQPAQASAVPNRTLLIDELSGQPSSEARLRAIDAAASALQAVLVPADLDAALRGAQALIDASLDDSDLEGARRLIGAVLRSHAQPEVIDAWMAESLSDARLQRVLEIHRAAPEDTLEALLDMLREIGERAMPTLLGLVAATEVAGERRQLADLVAALPASPEDVQALLTSEAEVEIGTYILARSGQTEDRAQLMALLDDQRPAARAGTVAVIDLLPWEHAVGIAERCLRDADPRVRNATIESLVRLGHAEAGRILEAAIHAPSIDTAEFEEKQALLVGWASLMPMRALLPLSKYVKKADGLLIRKEVEEIAVAAVLALEHIRQPRAVEVLKEGVASRNKRVRETARAALLRIKERSGGRAS